jgi:hypothetical protein
MNEKTLTTNKNNSKYSSLRKNQISLDNFYKMNDATTITKFIEKDNNLIFVLHSLPKLLLQFFEKSNFSLELANDIEENETTLFLGICTPLSYQEAFDKKRELFKNIEFKEIMKHKEVKKLLSIGIENY